MSITFTEILIIPCSFVIDWFLKNAWCGTLTTFQLLSNKKDAVGSLQKRNNQTNDKQIFSIIFDLI